MITSAFNDVLATENTSNYSSVTVIIPTRNEVQTIACLLSLLTEIYPEISIMVVDDSSEDGTQEAVLTFIASAKFNKRALNRGTITLVERGPIVTPGLTASIIHALERCGTEHFVIMDGDLQHPPQAVASVVAKLAGDSELVVGVREEFPADWPLIRRFISLVATGVSRAYLRSRGIKTTDPLSGFFGGKTEAVRTLLANYPKRFELRGYKILLDLLKVAPSNIRIAEVQYRFAVRAQGESKFNAMHGVYFLRSLFR